MASAVFTWLTFGAGVRRVVRNFWKLSQSRATIFAGNRSRPQHVALDACGHEVTHFLEMWIVGPAWRSPTKAKTRTNSPGLGIQIGVIATDDLDPSPRTMAKAGRRNAGAADPHGHASIMQIARICRSTVSTHLSCHDVPYRIV